MAEIISNFDLIALQEVMNEEGIIKLKEEIEKNSGKWNYIISKNNVGRTTYKEYYAFIYNENIEVLNINGFIQMKKICLKENLMELLLRLITSILHMLLYIRISERRNEALLFDEVYLYFQKINGIEDDIIIAGDFNLPAYDTAFDIYNIDNITYMLNPIQLTTIGNDGLTSAYDNMLYSTTNTNEYFFTGKTFDFTNNNFSEVRKTISDHLPVYVVLE